jgi:hypothetical protein
MLSCRKVKGMPLKKLYKRIKIMDRVLKKIKGALFKERLFVIDITLYASAFYENAKCLHSSWHLRSIRMLLPSSKKASH